MSCTSVTQLIFAFNGGVVNEAWTTAFFRNAQMREKVDAGLSDVALGDVLSKVTELRVQLVSN